VSFKKRYKSLASKTNIIETFSLFLLFHDISRNFPIYLFFFLCFSKKGEAFIFLA